MMTAIEIKLKHEDVIREETQKRFPSLDPDWVVCRWLDHMHENAKKTAEVLALMAPEISRVLRSETE